MALTEEDNGCTEGEGGESETMVKTCVLVGFSECAEAKALISSLSEVHSDLVATEVTMQKFLGEMTATFSTPLNWRHFAVLHIYVSHLQ